jgi:molybdate transport system permease protein
VNGDLAALLLTLRLAAISTALLLLFATPLAWWVARTQSRWKAPIEAAVALPLVLPPTVLGFYLLLALTAGTGGSPWGGSAAGRWCSAAGLSSPGDLLAAARCTLTALRAARPCAVEAAATLGAVRRSLLQRRAAADLRSFWPPRCSAAHTRRVGVVLMIGGNIPNRTRVSRPSTTTSRRSITPPAPARRIRSRSRSRCCRWSSRSTGGTALVSARWTRMRSRSAARLDAELRAPAAAHGRAPAPASRCCAAAGSSRARSAASRLARNWLDAGAALRRSSAARPVFQDAAPSRTRRCAEIPST